MDIEGLRRHCLAKPGVTEELPFGPDTLVFKVGGKMFALSGLEDLPSRVNLKCDPERAVELRERYPAVRPGWHMDKRNWNTVVFDGSIPDRALLGWVDDSYELVRGSLPKKVRETLDAG